MCFLDRLPFFMPNTFAEKAPGTWGDYALGGGKALYNEGKSVLSLLIPSIPQTPIPPQQRSGAMGAELLMIGLPTKFLKARKAGKVFQGRKGAFGEAKRKAGIFRNQHPDRVRRERLEDQEALHPES